MKMCIAGLIFVTLLAAPRFSKAQEVKKPATTLKEVVVTASRRPESVSHLASTMQVITDDDIAKSNAISITDLLVENAVGFFSEWTPGQTSINIRGAKTDGQGRDFKSQVAVLINGRRAGTANLSKLSLEEVKRIEIIRGPASVIYGSQAMGGVINIITKNGRNTKGAKLAVATGSWSRLEGSASIAKNYNGRFDYYAGIHGNKRGDYESGKDSKMKMYNTDYKRYGGLVSLDYRFSVNHRLELITRSDGVYDAGFRGSSWDYDNYDNRYNQSLDLIYSGSNSSKKISWKAHYYYFKDEDDLHWGAETIYKKGRPAPGYDSDHIDRTLKAHGLKLYSNLELIPNNTLLTGADLEWSKLRSNRHRTPMPGNLNKTQTPPYDNNSNSSTYGLYLEDEHRLFNDSLILRGGGRFSFHRESIKETPNQPLLIENTQNLNFFTYSLGLTYLPLDWVALRVGLSTGYRAPTATELAADFVPVLGSKRTIGNPNLDPETSTNFEIGALFTTETSWIDIAWFQNIIDKRIKRVNIDKNTRQYINGKESVVRGIEIQTKFNIAKAMGSNFLWNVFANGAYNYEFEDRDPAAKKLNSDHIQRMYEYQASLGTTIGQTGLWDFTLNGILHGPMWYNTEEKLLIPEGEPNRRWVHKKDSFWVFNIKGRYFLNKNIMLWAGINNLFDENNHSIFIALNKEPYISNPAFSNGGRGNSMPGREFLAGLEVRF